MAWSREAITDGELDALKEAAQRAWGDDTRLLRYAGHPRPSFGQCYVVSRWLVERLGGTVGVRHGHFAWLSPDGSYVVDLTGGHTGNIAYEPNDGYESYPVLDNERTARFNKRANHIFDNLDRLLKLGLDYAGDAYPAEEPQASSDSEQFDSYWHDEPQGTTFDPGYQFVYANGQLEVSPNHSHDELAGHAGIDPNGHTGPFAAGHITVVNGRATWEVSSNVNATALMRVFKDYGKRVGWEWGGLSNMGGEPINDEFAPKKTSVLQYVYASGHLYLGRSSHSELLLSARGKEPVLGWVRIAGSRAEVSPVHIDALPSLFEWAEDSGLTLYAGNDNVIKTIPNLQQFNNGLDDSTPLQDTNPFFDKRVDEREPSGLYRCPACDRLFPGWNEYQKHRRDEEPWADPQEDGKFPELNTDAPSPFEPHFTPQQPDVFPVSSVLPSSAKVAARVAGFSKYASIFGYDTDEGYNHYVAFLSGSPVGYASVREDGHIQMVQTAVQRRGVARSLLKTLMRYHTHLSTNTMHDWEAEPLHRLGWVNTRGQMWKWAAGQTPSQTLDAPIPFLYDVQEDQVTVGQAGTRTSDIPGKFTPGGIVEGTYEPGGKVMIRSMTTIPYTVRHLIQLWYYQHPELEVKSVHLQDDAGKNTKLASMLPALVAASPAAYVAWRALKPHGRVYVVGGAVRDAVLGTAPKDVDLMVTGVPGELVSQTLSAYGQIKVTGKDFGVIRYRHMSGDEVEVALPRRERSTGPRYQDFDVQSDHTMKPEEDLYRRDFTANAMAFDLADGRLIDPFGGAVDIAAGTLRTLNDTSLSEDPLRVVRALVAHARFGLDPDEATGAQMTKSAHSLKYLPEERVQIELDKLMASQDPVAGIRLAHATGVLQHIFPEVEKAFGYDQKNPHHAHDLGTHLLEVLDNMVRITPDVDMRYAALLHDIGKPASAWWHPEDKRSKYYEFRPDRDLIGAAEDGSPLTITAGTFVGQDHHKVGAEVARERLRTLKFPNARIDRICGLIRYHMWSPFESAKGARKFLAKVGPHADDLLKFRVADQGGKGDALVIGKGRTPEGIRKQADLVERVRNAQQPTQQADLAINGHDLIALGVPQGPAIGHILQRLTAAVIEDPDLNTREQLLDLAPEHARLQP